MRALALQGLIVGLVLGRLALAAEPLAEKYEMFKGLTDAERAQAIANYQTFKSLPPERQAKIREWFARFEQLPADEQAKRIARLEAMQAQEAPLPGEPPPAAAPVANASGTAAPAATAPLHGVFAALPMGQSIPPEVLKNADLAGVVLILPWKNVEAKKDKFNWARADERINEARSAGKQVVLDLQDALEIAPDWLLQSVGTVTLIETRPRFKDRLCHEYRLPLPWDPELAARRKNFFSQAGAHFAGRSEIVGVRVAFANADNDSWGLPRLQGYSRECDTAVDQVKAWHNAGYTTAKMAQVGTELIQAAAGAFPNLPLLVPVEFNGKLDDGPLKLARQIVRFGFQNFSSRFYPVSFPVFGDGNAARRTLLFSILRPHTPFLGWRVRAGDWDPRRTESGLLQGLGLRASYFEVNAKDATYADFGPLMHKAVLMIGH